MTIKDQRQKEDIYNKVRYPEQKLVGDQLLLGDITKVKMLLNDTGVHCDNMNLQKIFAGQRPDKFGAIDIAKQIIADYKKIKRQLKKSNENKASVSVCAN